MTNISVLIPTKNEEKNIKRCLDSLRGWTNDIVVVDSRSTDKTTKICNEYGATILEFDYKGGWPKKRQWALDNHDFKNEWVLLLDADEILDEFIKNEISNNVKNSKYDGFMLKLEMFFLGKQLKYGGELYKLALFRVGYGKFEKRIGEQNETMADMEIHEHVIVNGKIGKIKSPIRHENVNSLSRYIIKHDEYSNWEAAVLTSNEDGEINPDIFGSQAQRRRWLKKTFIGLPGSPFIYFLYRYIFKLGFLDGRAGYIYSLFKLIQLTHVKMKMYELKINKNGNLYE